MNDEQRRAGAPEPWVSKKGVAAHYGFSVRWVEYQLVRGLPSTLIGGQRRFRLSETDRFLLEGEVTSR